MTDDELDLLLLDLFQKILADMKDCQKYVKNLNTPEYKEINEDYERNIKNLQKIISQVKNLNDLAICDEDTINGVYEYIQSYADNFIISNIESQKQKDLDTYSKIEELLYMFLDDDSEDEEFED